MFDMSSTLKGTNGEEFLPVPKMNTEVKELWCEALESVKYLQGRTLLRYDEAGHERFCALGILVDLYGQKHGLKWKSYKEVVSERVTIYFLEGFDSMSSLPNAVSEWAFNSKSYNDPVVIYRGTATNLSYLNDVEEMDFKTIASLVRQQY